MKFTKKLLALLFATILVTACNESQVLDTGTSPQGETNVGTNVGNPLPPGKNLISISTVSDTQSRHFCQMLVNTSAYSCKITPQNYQLGVLAVYMNECRDQSGATTNCDPATLNDVSNRITLYSGELVQLTATDSGVEFPYAWSLPQNTSIQAGALQAVVAYIGATLPDETTDPDGAKYVMPALRGVSYRICTTPNESVGKDSVRAYCGDANARMGDIRFDTDRDGVYNYLDIAALTPNSAPETSIRSEVYNEVTTGLLDFVFGDPESKTWLVSQASDYGITGFYAPMFPFDAVETFDDTAADTELAVSLDVTKTLHFEDGAGFETDDLTCVNPTSGLPCDIKTLDPESYGVYNPYFDGFFTPLPASSSVSIR